jgi:hypothetical protein
MAINSEKVSFASQSCSNIRKVTVEGSELNDLKSLVVQVLVGDPANQDDGLQDIFQKFHSNGKPPMPTQTIAVGKWLSNPDNQELYNRLKKFGLEPRTENCRLKEPAVFCPMTEKREYPASPDFYLNLIKLAEQLDKPDNKSTSLSYYLFDLSMPSCPYFGLHKGVLGVSENSLKIFCTGN